MVLEDHIHYSAGIVSNRMPSDASPSERGFIEYKLIQFKEINMALTPNELQDILKKHGTGPNDTGSPQAQVAVLTARLAYLNDHFKAHKNDHHSRTGLMKLVGRRRRLLDYLRRTDTAAYKTLITDLGIRK